MDETITAAWRGRALGGGTLDLEAGHVTLADPGAVDATGAGFPIVGASGLWSAGSTRAAFSLGRARYRVEGADGDAEKPTLFTTSIGRGTKSSSATLGLFVADGGSLDGGADVILTPGLARRVSLSTELFAEVPLRAGGGAGYRAGARWNRLAYGVEAALFDHPGEFPRLLPLYRPGESGFELAGHVAPGARTLIRATTTFLRKDRFDTSEDFRGRLVLSHAFPARAARLLLFYDHNQYQYRGLDDRDEGGRRNRLAASLGSHRFGDTTDVRIHHDFASPSHPDQTQVTFQWARTRERLNVIGEAIVQREGAEARGAALEGAIYLPWRSRYHWILGGAATSASRQGETSGEGAIRLGIVRRNAFVEGWSGGLEVRIPVAIGLSPVDSEDVQIAVSAGNRFTWEHAGDLLPAFGPFGRMEGRGTIEGVVTAGGPLKGIPILLDGRPVAITDEEGRFRLARVPEGAVAIGVDLSRADPSISGEESRIVNVVRGEVARVEFPLERGYFVQGALLCREPPVPVANASLVLVGEEIAYRAETSAVGGFQFANVRPGRYALLIDPESGTPRVDAEQPAIDIDVAEDRRGEIIRVGCAP